MPSRVRTRRFHQLAHHLAQVATGATVVCMLASAAHADDKGAERPQTEAKREVRWAGPLELIVDGESAAFAIKAHSSNITFVWFPRGVKDWSMPVNAGFTVKRWGSKALYISVNEYAPKGAEAGLRVWSDDYQCSLHLRSAEKLSEVTRQDSIVVKHGDDKRRELEAEAKRLAAREAREREAILRPTDEAEPRDGRRPRDEVVDPSRIVARDRVLRDGLPVLRPHFRVEQLNEDALDVTFIDGQWIDQNDFLVRFSAKNPALQPSAFYNVSALDREGVPLDVDVIHPRTNEDKDKGRIATISPNDHIDGGILIRNAADYDLRGLHFEFRTLLGTRSVTSIGEVTHFRPVSEYEIENTLRDREALGRITIQVQPMLGVIWLENPLAADDLDATSVKGLGVRVGYGINRLLSFEGELMGASSGEASFSGSMNGTAGTATRNATLGRAQIGGVLRFGYQYVPTVRLGLGFQGANHGTRFTPESGGSMPGPDDGFKVDMVISLGAGLDIKLGKHWMIGMAGSFSGGLLERSRVLEAGIHLSYSWQPRTSDDH